MKMQQAPSEQQSCPKAAMSESIQEKDQAPVAKLGSRSRWRAYILVSITLAGLLVCFLLAVPFLPALTWSIALAILFAPSHQLLADKLKRPNLAAAISVFWIGLIIIVPAALLGGRLMTEAATGANTMKEMAAAGEWRRAMEGQGALRPFLEWIDQINLPDVIGTVASLLATTSASLVRGGLMQLVTVLLTFYLLFFFLRDREAVLTLLREISPLSEDEMNRLMRRIADTVMAILYGTVAVATLQGVLGGFIFWLLGLPAPLLWGVVMGILAIVPVFGTFVIWFPTAIFLALEGSWEKALILTAWGTIVIGCVDNLLYPMLVGNRLRLHTIPAFMSVVGGVVLFGAPGIILGPLAVTVTVFLLELWRISVRQHVPRVP
jgi:predicted PurR-regulated permease PerM